MATLADKITVFHHFTLPVTDMARTERFYTQVLGAEVVRRRTVGSVTHLSISLPNTPRIDLFPGTARESPGDHPHFALDVPPAMLNECAALLESHGVGYDGPRQQGPVGTASIYFDDPDGNHWELTCHGYPEGAPLKQGPLDRASLRYTWR